MGVEQIERLGTGLHADVFCKKIPTPPLRKWGGENTPPKKRPPKKAPKTGHLFEN